MSLIDLFTVKGHLMTTGGNKPNGEGSGEAGTGPPEPEQGGDDMVMHSDNNAYALVDPILEPAVDLAIQNHLGRKLKASYDELVRQPVPDKFRLLLEVLERQEKKP